MKRQNLLRSQAILLGVMVRSGQITVAELKAATEGVEGVPAELDDALRHLEKRGFVTARKVRHGCTLINIWSATTAGQAEHQRISLGIVRNERGQDTNRRRRMARRSKVGRQEDFGAGRL